MEKNSLDMAAAKLLHDLWWKDTTGKSPSEDCVELLVQSANPHFGEVPVWVDDGLPLHLPLPLARQLQLAALSLVEHHSRVGDQDSGAETVLNNLALLYLGTCKWKVFLDKGTWRRSVASIAVTVALRNLGVL